MPSQEECIKQKVGTVTHLCGSYRSYSAEFGIVQSVNVITVPELRASKSVSEVAGPSAALLNLTESLS